MSLKFRAVATAVFCATVFIGASPGNASASEVAPATTHCVTQLSAPDPVTRTVTIVSRQCTTDKQSSKQLNARAASASLLLIRFWETANYGNYNDSIYGALPCDTAGFGISDMDRFNLPFKTIHEFTSYRMFNGCNSAILYMGEDYGGTSSGWRNGDSPNVGQPYNDVWLSMRVRHA